MEIRCRMCAEIFHNNIDVSENASFLSMANHFFQIKITIEDKLPTTVCEGCFDFVERIWQFKGQVDRAQILLTNILNSIEKLPIHVNETRIPPLSLTNEETKFPIIGTNNVEINTVIISTEKQVDEQKSSYHVQSAEAPSYGRSESQQIDEKLSHCKKSKKSSTASKTKAKLEELNTFTEIEFINPDRTVVPNPGIHGWDAYPWTCCDCSLVFLRAELLKDHCVAAHNIVSVKYLCADCPKVYSKYVSFINHVKYHKPFLKFCCDVCYKWYETSKEIKEHQITHVEDEPYQCTTCGKRFRVQSLLTVHNRSHLPSSVKNCYPCDQCPKKFGTKPNLIAHKRIHLGIKDYSCNQCGKSFVQKGNLDNHLLIHNSNRPFKCNVCDKTFKSLIRLRNHSSIHSGLKPHQCDTCRRQFREKSTLREHQRIHTGVMPFTCEFCGKSFRFKGVLTTHRRQHTGERPYSCTECQHHFTDWPNYNKHMKRRHGINTSVNCRTLQEIPPTGKPNRNPPGTVLAAPQAPVVHVICQTNNGGSLEPYREPPAPTFFPVLGLYGISDDMSKAVVGHFD
ncbi:gastrula zinc finger protein XlCGF26.1-like isoform X1 [Anthonomus grandis grandis]|uniref:gastrula zinc finger protein XlCGF26.1-like isoform X1 n=1 Tax=Anthonomus grandis grandis TaxID=2921223 RepID=UPI002166559B|nr:gastrula zinc finger protein XlCGF26.1-like isoform X1 [Anthonomus grandis grandis]